jgi:hypothetical protein
MSATLREIHGQPAMNGPRIDIYAAPTDLTDPVTAPEETLGPSGGRHRRPARFARARRWAETVAVSTAVLAVLVLTRSHEPSGTARHAAVAHAAEHATAKVHVPPAEVDLYAPNVFGTNSRGQIGTYDPRGRWHPYRGYVTPTEAQNLALVHIHSPAATHSAHRTPRIGRARLANYPR